MQLYSNDSQNNRPDSVNASENKKDLTPCGKEKTIKRYISGKTFALPYCGNQYCYPCERDKKLSKVPESIVYNTYRAKYHFSPQLISETIRIFPKYQHLSYLFPALLDIIR